MKTVNYFRYHLKSYGIGGGTSVRSIKNLAALGIS